MHAYLRSPLRSAGGNRMATLQVARSLANRHRFPSWPQILQYRVTRQSVVTPSDKANLLRDLVRQYIYYLIRQGELPPGAVTVDPFVFDQGSYQTRQVLLSIYPSALIKDIMGDTKETQAASDKSSDEVDEQNWKTAQSALLGLGVRLIEDVEMPLNDQHRLDIDMLVNQSLAERMSNSEYMRRQAISAKVAEASRARRVRDKLKREAKKAQEKALQIGGPVAVERVKRVQRKRRIARGLVAVRREVVEDQNRSALYVRPISSFYLEQGLESDVQTNVQRRVPTLKRPPLIFDYSPWLGSRPQADSDVALF